MRIISNFKDYYDSSIGYGIDPTVVYKRMMERYNIQHRSWRMKDGFDPNNDQIVKDVLDACPTLNRVCGDIFHHVYVGFCGKIYVGLAYHVHASAPTVPTVSSSFWDGTFRQYETSWQFAWSERDVDPEELTKPRNSQFTRGFNQCETMQDWFDRNEKLRVHPATDVFTKHGIVSFIVHDKELITDGILSAVRFQRVMDNFTAFQEISMFVSGVLGTFHTVEPEPITDVQRAQTKGFDKQSFRRSPTKKKRG